jgi:hypothetical protein
MGMKMTFDDVWREVKGLPKMAIAQVPKVLSKETKKRLEKLKPEEVSMIVAQAIDEVNQGSVVPLDELIRKRL